MPLRLDPAQGADSVLFARLESLAGRRGPALACLWALGEATWWPIMPDFALAPLAAARPTATAWLALGATGGMLFGGTVTYALARVAPRLVERQPLVTDAMRAAVTRWFDAEGPRGVVHQPFSFVPYKAFAREAGRRRLPLADFLAWSLVGRGARFGAVCALGALVGSRRRTALRRHFGRLALIYSLAFAAGLVAAVRHAR